MQISRDKAKKYLAVLWFISAAVLFILLYLQTILGHYEQNIDKVWGWFLPNILPTLSLIVGVIVTDALAQTIKTEKIDRFVFLLAFGLSITYLIVVLFTIVLQPMSPLPPLDLMSLANLWLGPFQGLVSASLGAFFIQNQKN